jgi:hypothetical protein
LRAAWDDLEFGLKHYSDFERIAMVGDRKWEEWMANFCKPFTRLSEDLARNFSEFLSWAVSMKVPGAYDNRSNGTREVPSLRHVGGWIQAFSGNGKECGRRYGSVPIVRLSHGAAMSTSFYRSRR